MNYSIKQSRWNALRVRSHFESVVVKHLKKRRIEHFLPLQERSEDSSTKSPLFPGYVFSKCDPEAELSLMYIPGVLDAKSIRHPLPDISEREIEDLQQAVQAGFHVWPWPFALGDRKVKIENGALRGVVGILEGLAGRRLLILSVHLIQRSIAIELGENSVLSVAAADNLPWIRHE